MTENQKKWNDPEKVKLLLKLAGSTENVEQLTSIDITNPKSMKKVLDNLDEVVNLYKISPKIIEKVVDKIFDNLIQNFNDNAQIWDICLKRWQFWKLVNEHNYQHLLDNLPKKTIIDNLYFKNALKNKINYYLSPDSTINAKFNKLFAYEYNTDIISSAYINAKAIKHLEFTYVYNEHDRVNALVEDGLNLQYLLTDYNNIAFPQVQFLDENNGLYLAEVALFGNKRGIPDLQDVNLNVLYLINKFTKDSNSNILVDSDTILSIATAFPDINKNDQWKVDLLVEYSKEYLTEDYLDNDNILIGILDNYAQTHSDITSQQNFSNLLYDSVNEILKDEDIIKLSTIGKFQQIIRDWQHEHFILQEQTFSFDKINNVIEQGDLNTQQIISAYKNVNPNLSNKAEKQQFNKIINDLIKIDRNFLTAFNEKSAFFNVNNFENGLQDYYNLVKNAIAIKDNNLNNIENIHTITSLMQNIDLQQFKQLEPNKDYLEPGGDTAVFNLTIAGIGNSTCDIEPHLLSLMEHLKKYPNKREDIINAIKLNIQNNLALENEVFLENFDNAPNNIKTFDIADKQDFLNNYANIYTQYIQNEIISLNEHLNKLDNIANDIINKVPPCLKESIDNYSIDNYLEMAQFNAINFIINDQFPLKTDKLDIINDILHSNKPQAEQVKEIKEINDKFYHQILPEIKNNIKTMEFPQNTIMQNLKLNIVNTINHNIYKFEKEQNYKCE